MSTLLLLSALAVAAAPIDAEADLTGKLGAPAVRVDVSKHYVFGLRWREPILRGGFFRDVSASFATPGISTHLGLVIVGTGEGRVEARRLTTGKLVWAYTHGAPFETSVAVVPSSGRPRSTAEASVAGGARVAATGARELAILGSRDGTLLALASDSGQLVWKADIGGDMRAPLSVAGNVIVVATANNRVAALDLASGSVLWTAGRSPPTALTIVGHGQPLVFRDTVYATFSDGYVAAYALADGAERWAKPLSTRTGELCDADADPVMGDGRLFVASYSDGVFALNPTDGQVIWSKSLPAVTSLAVYEKNIVVGSGNGFVWSLQQSDARLVYRTKLADGAVTRMQSRQGLIVFAAGDDGLIVLNAKNGQPLQASAYGGHVLSHPGWVDDHVAMVSSSGNLYLFTRDAQLARGH